MAPDGYKSSRQRTDTAGDVSGTPASSSARRTGMGTGTGTGTGVPNDFSSQFHASSFASAPSRGRAHLAHARFDPSRASRNASLGVGLGGLGGVGFGAGAGLGNGRSFFSSDSSALGRTPPMISFGAVRDPTDPSNPMHQMTFEGLATGILPPQVGQLPRAELMQITRQAIAGFCIISSNIDTMIGILSNKTGLPKHEVMAMCESHGDLHRTASWLNDAMAPPSPFRPMPQQHPDDASMLSVGNPHSNGISTDMSIDGRSQRTGSVPMSVGDDADDLTMVSDMMSISIADRRSFKDIAFGNAAALMAVSEEAGITAAELESLAENKQPFCGYWDERLEVLSLRGFFKSPHFSEWKIKGGIPASWVPDHGRDSVWNEPESKKDGRKAQNSHSERHKVLCAFWKGVFVDFNNKDIPIELKNTANKRPCTTKKSATPKKKGTGNY